MSSFLSMPQDETLQGLALGKFDGMHLAHKALFAYLPPKSALLCIESKGEALTPYKESYSPYPIISINFEDIMQWNGAYFMEILQSKFPSLQCIVVGYDFAFGKNRAYSANDLTHFFNGKVVVVPQFCINGIGVHSSVIKTSIRNGNMFEAATMLGRYYQVRGSITTGQNLGAKSLYATINIHTQHYILPQNGVYASFTHINGELMPSVNFVGHRLSTDNAFSIETHIIDKELWDITDKEVEIYFVQKIRDNQKFANLEFLKKQITQDIRESKAILAQANIAYFS